MSTPPDILYVQRRPRRAGAQTSLFRLISSSPHSSHVLTSSKGWLSDALEKVSVREWPSPRSLRGRLGGLRSFAKNFAKEIKPPGIVVANDHHECLLALALANVFSVPCVAILRTPGMSQHDFQKHHCADCAHLFVVGNELNERVGQWSDTSHSLFMEGFLEEEFAAERPAPSSCPSEILIAGSEEPRKGFPDFLKALEILEKSHPDLPITKVALTGQTPDGDIPKLRCQLDFVGRVNDFIPFAQGFDFAIHPSRSETFGLAPLELIIAGIPTLCTRTGIAGDDLLPSSWLTPPSSPQEMATALLDWIHHWQDRRKELKSVEEAIHSRFAICRTSAHFFEIIDRLSVAT